MRIDSPLVKEGARRVIGRNLGLRPGEDVVIIVDETTIRVGRTLAEGARHYEVRPTVITVLQADQPNYINRNALPLPLARAIDAAQAVAIAVSDQPAGTGFRVNILRQSRQLGSKVAMMPGITLEMIADLARTDYELLVARCEALRLPLLLGQKVAITTVDVAGHPHTLHVKLGGWDRPPTLSSGIVRPQSFDNVPSGEVYVPPVKGTANGDIIVNGSVTGHVFGPGDEIRLTFRDGALAQITPQDHPATHFLNQTIEQARVAGDREPHFLCELGIGVNPVITTLIGKSLMDEKATGTAHVAIGANEPFGGDVAASNIHEDLVFREPTINVDGRLIVQTGEVCVRDRDWRHSYRDVKVSPPYDGEDFLVIATGVDPEYGAGGLLQRIYFDGTDTRSTIYVGSNATAKLAADLYARIPETEPIPARRLAELSGHSMDVVRSILYIMGEVYALVRASPQAIAQAPGSKSGDY